MRSSLARSRIRSDASGTPARNACTRSLSLNDWSLRNSGRCAPRIEKGGRATAGTGAEHGGLVCYCSSCRASYLASYQAVTAWHCIIYTIIHAHYISRSRLSTPPTTFGCSIAPQWSRTLLLELCSGQRLLSAHRRTPCGRRGGARRGSVARTPV